MNSETFLDFCFVREAKGDFSSEIETMLEHLFKGIRLHWYLEEKRMEDAEMVIAEVKGMSRWQSEDEVIEYLEEKAGEGFWQYLQGYKMFVYPVKKGCSSCENH